ncbi:MULTISPECIES: TlpA disulfide reductase family protein [Burkholderiaceae]|jgi:thiol-disulfide isomerase/thioredoxin|uniref:TlpA family protein disulfide reductase n=1 Tax=Paraburkholderia fungorum TaxID=134537 RepID=A0AAP5UYH5_9BURK|nr:MULTISPECIES: TlpA disulfide reductase family protein [Burkholderiaceae]MDT8843086.1 TlpA family protein disulfide reductase [Paraburkholderia fungorum]USX11164.1 TlpA family protein disulfide reductase [Paraburkholderia fungorum]
MVTLLGINISFDRLIFFAAFFSATCLLRIVSRKSKHPSVYRYSALLDEAAVCGLLVARLGYVAGHMDAYRAHPYEVLFFWLPGYAPLYGLAGGLTWALLRIWRGRRTHTPSLRVLATAALPLVIALLYLSVQTWENPTGKDSQIADALNNLPMTGTDGQPLILQNLKGHSIVVNLWASWCVPCRMELPILQDASQRLQKSGLIVVGLDLYEARSQALAFASARGVTYVIASPIHSSETTRTQIDRLINFIGSNVIPVSIFIDASGKVRAVLPGILSPGTIDDWVRRYSASARERNAST